MARKTGWQRLNSVIARLPLDMDSLGNDSVRERRKNVLRLEIETADLGASLS